MSFKIVIVILLAILGNTTKTATEIADCLKEKKCDEKLTACVADTECAKKINDDLITCTTNITAKPEDCTGYDKEKGLLDADNLVKLASCYKECSYKNTGDY